ncbi:MAG: helix-turn-helix transcriptional regulator [Bacillota bacterium]
MNVAKHLQKLRKDKGYSVYKLAKLSDISSTYLHEIERGEKQPTVEKIIQICNGLGITLSDFFAEEEPELNPELKKLLQEAKELSPHQLKAIINTVKAMKK